MKLNLTFCWPCIMQWFLVIVQLDTKNAFCIQQFRFWKSCRSWDNVAEYGAARQVSDYNILRRNRIACWMTHVTDTHSEFVILFFFSLQQWLRDRASVLRCIVHCLICPYWSCLWTCGLSSYLILLRALLGWWRNSVWFVRKTVCSSLCSFPQLPHIPTKASSQHHRYVLIWLHYQVS